MIATSCGGSETDSGGYVRVLASMYPLEYFAAQVGGDRVQVESAHGTIEAVAWLNTGIRPTAVFIPIGWGEKQPFNPWRSVNYLTDKTQRDPISDQTNLKALLCRIERL